MSKSREAIFEKVAQSNLKKSLSKSRERLCDVRLTLSKSREFLNNSKIASRSQDKLPNFKSLSKSQEVLSTALGGAMKRMVNGAVSDISHAMVNASLVDFLLHPDQTMMRLNFESDGNESCSNVDTSEKNLIPLLEEQDEEEQQNGGNKQEEKTNNLVVIVEDVDKQSNNNGISQENKEQLLPNEQISDVKNGESEEENKNTNKSSANTVEEKPMSKVEENVRKYDLTVEKVNLPRSASVEKVTNSIGVQVDLPRCASEPPKAMEASK